jgi:hypothetical protein
LRFFGGLGFVFFFFSLICLLFSAYHWITAGSLTPYKFVGFAGVYLFSFALFVWVVGIVADMFDRMLGNQERIITRLKKIDYEERIEK